MLTNDHLIAGKNSHQVWCVFETYVECTIRGSGKNNRVPFHIEVFGIYENAKADLEHRLADEPHTVAEYGPKNEIIYYHEHRMELNGQLEAIYTEGDHTVEIGDGFYFLTTIEELLEKFDPLPIGPFKERKKKMGANFDWHIDELEEMEAIIVDREEEEED